MTAVMLHVLSKDWKLSGGKTKSYFVNRYYDYDLISYTSNYEALPINILYVSRYEALFLLILYALYIVMMVYNKKLEEFANTLNIPFKNVARDEKSSLFMTTDGKVDQTQMVPQKTDGAEASQQGNFIHIKPRLILYVFLI